MQSVCLHRSRFAVKRCSLKSEFMNRSKKLSSQITIRLDEELRAGLADAAAADERSVSSYIVRVLRAHMESLKSKKPKAKG
jgi:predicted HicB family RNase H-like nuclease